MSHSQTSLGKPCVEGTSSAWGFAAPAANRASLLRRALANLGAAAVLIGLVEGACRLRGHGCVLEPPVYQASDDSPGYRLASNRQARVWQFARVISVTSNGEGERATLAAALPDAERVEVYGDSQVFGWGLSDAETPPARLQQVLGERYRVSNHGVPGYGPLEYRRALDQLDGEPWVVLVFTEQNDLSDAFGERQLASAVCGYMTSSSSWLGQLTPCWIRNSRALQWGAAAFRDWGQDRQPTPLSFDALSQVAARVLMSRIVELVRTTRRRFGARLVVTYVPWSAQYCPDRLAHFTPHDETRRTVTFPDDCAILASFEQQPARAGLYLAGDDHLSSRGAAVLARAIAARIVSQQGSPEQ